MNVRVVLADYDPAWPTLYEVEAQRIALALGTAALALHHAGSTAVPGLAAKPVIDIVLAVADSRDEAFVGLLEPLGYELRVREPDWHEHRMLRHEAPAVNLHVFSNGSPEVERMLRFRDRLRADPAARQRYEDAKRALADRDWGDIQDYADAKAGVVEEILRAAGGQAAT